MNDELESIEELEYFIKKHIKDKKIYNIMHDNIELIFEILLTYDEIFKLFVFLNAVFAHKNKDELRVVLKNYEKHIDENVLDVSFKHIDFDDMFDSFIDVLVSIDELKSKLIFMDINDNEEELIVKTGLNYSIELYFRIFKLDYNNFLLVKNNEVKISEYKENDVEL